MAPCGTAGAWPLAVLLASQLLSPVVLLDSQEEEWARRDATAPAVFAGQTEPLVESLREGRWGGGGCNM